jgi:uncharacterized protein YjbI with pentapeptide repeats
MRKIFPMVLTSVSSKIVKPVLIVSGAAVVFVSLWSFQQDNINSLEQKIDKLSVKIVKASSIDERLKLEKDILGFEKDKTIIQNGAYTNLVQALGGLVLSMTAWVGYKNFKVGEDKQVTERFSKSIEHLGSDKIDIRLGGIYALEQIAIDSAKYHWTIVEILSAFVREKCPLDDVATPTGSSEKTLLQVRKKVSADIQAAMTVLGRRKVEQDPRGKEIDLRNVNLPFIEIQKANLSGANLFGANLSKASLFGANLSKATLFGANLSKATLSKVNLSEASLSGANLSGADLSGADLREASLSGANLSGADLSGADLSGAFLREASLSGTNLTAFMSRADLSRADLNRTNLIDVKIKGARFGNNQGISDDMKKELDKQGAIFDDYFIG